MSCWAFAEFTDVDAMQQDFAAPVERTFDRLIDSALRNIAMCIT